MHAVRDLLTARRAEGSRPGRRTDGAFLALAVEGGGSRGAYSGGMVAALEELGLTTCFDAVYGSSAGSLNGAWFLAGQARSGVVGWYDPAVVRRVTNLWRALRGGPVVDTAHLVEVIYPSIPMDFAAILASPVTFHPLATDVDTGAATDLRPHIKDPATLRLALRASVGLPILAGRPVAIDGHRYIDAGLAEAIPFRTAVDSGATHVLVLRTRRAGIRHDPPAPVESRVVTRYLRRVAPAALEAWENRHTRLTADEDHLDGHPHILQIHPPTDSPDVSRLSRDSPLLRRAVELGQEAVLKALS